MIRLFSDRVLVEAIEEQPTSGLISVSEPEYRRGRVVAYGPGYVTRDGILHPTQVGIGDVIIYHWVHAHKVDVGLEENQVIVNQSDIIGVITGDETPPID